MTVSSVRRKRQPACVRFRSRMVQSAFFKSGRARQAELDNLVFATRTGKAISPNNVLRRSIFPACEVLGLPHATWLTFRRTYSSWSHEKGVPGKVLAQLMGHANVDTTLNLYTQVLDGSLRMAVEKIGSELFMIVHCGKGKGAAN